VDEVCLETNIFKPQPFPIWSLAAQEEILLG
jgi:hypothetical protein